MNDLLKNLTEADFAAADIQLYLDTHPTDTKALADYNDYVRRAADLRGKYEAQYGPLTSFRSASAPDRFNYLTEVFPWQQEFNR
jgi:spore coat protein JB